MYRKDILFLNKWKESKTRKPLIIQGARQVGKTWLMKKFGEESFKNTIYLNFEKSERLRQLFVLDFNLERIILSIEVECGKRVDSQNTLLIFDEIQAAENGLTVLKYFYEERPDLYIVAAGSLLGVSLQKNNSFPVGKVDFLPLNPLSFYDFLENTGETVLAQELKNNTISILPVFHDKLCHLLRLYYFIGGMPEAIQTYIDSKDLDEVRQVQKKILIGYENDFSKHAPTAIVPRIIMVWNSILSQLAKENRKFIYGQVKSGSRAKDFEQAINWLVNAGLLLQVYRISKPGIPLKAYSDYDAFKLFLIDVGLLNAMGQLDAKLILEKNQILTEYKGALTEQFVCQQLNQHHELYYWSAENATSELDFLIQHENKVIPIEVKAEENLKSKSLRVFTEKYPTTNAIRLSMKMLKIDKNLSSMPLYLAENCASWLPNITLSTE